MSETRRVKAIIVLLVISVCLASFVLLHLLQSGGNIVSSDLSEASSLPADDVEVVENETGSQSNLRVEARADAESKLAVGSLLLGEACGEQLDENALSDEKCLDALESHFMDEPVYTLYLFGMTPQPSPYTFRQVFDSYNRDRELVIETLTHPECRLLEGPIRMDLRKTCNADAVFRYVHFANLCMDHVEFELVRTANFRTNEYRYEANLTLLEELKTEDPPSGYQGEWDGGLANYYTERNRMREEILREAWLDSNAKCTSFVWDLDLSEVREVAGRLGFEQFFVVDENALSNRLWTIGYRDDLFLESTESMFRWKTQLDAANWSQYSRDAAPGLAAAARGLAGMRNAGYETDVEEVIMRFCGRDRTDDGKGFSECAKALTEAEEMLDPTDVDSLRMLDELTSEALRLGLYTH